jgi:hypothetical protein
LKKTAIALLIALVCWLYPIKLLAQTAPQNQTKTEYKNQDYVSEDIIIKDNAIQRTDNLAADSGILQSSRPVHTRPARNDPTENVIPSGRDYSKEEVQQLIRDYSAQYGISAELPLRIANCESGFNKSSKNRTSTASGVFQYLNSTWNNTEAGRQGISVFDADANIRMAVSSIATHGTAPWLASKNCWSK